jgi:hypothetical protein
VARTAEGTALTEAHRQLQGRVSAATIRDLLRLWALVDPTDLRGTLDPFARAALAIVRGGHRASATAAQRYYVAFRQMERVEGAVVVTMAPPPPDEYVVGALRGAGVAGIKNARSRGASVQEAHDNGFVNLAGSAARIVANGSRETLLGAIQGDPEAHGFQRVTDGSPCAFCAMVASRGIVSKEEASAGFKAHGHCGCTAEPAFEGSALRPANAAFRAAWHESTSGLSGPDALAAFRRHLAGPQSTT